MGKTFLQGTTNNGVTGTRKNKKIGFRERKKKHLGLLISLAVA